MARCHYVGLMIQILRQRRRLSAQAMMGRLEQHGYPISEAIYNEIEHGAYLPRDERAFLRAITTGLDLTKDEVEMLLNFWALATLTPEMGEDLARESLRKELIMVCMAP